MKQLHNDSADRETSLRRCVPALFSAQYKTVLYVGARTDRFEFSEVFKNDKYEITVLEAWKDNVNFLKTLPFLKKIIEGDVRECEKLLTNKYDVIFWWHGPEHLAENEISPTLQKLELFCKHLIILGCPWGEYKQGSIGGNPFEVHKSYLLPEFFNKLGYNTETLWEPKPGGNITIWKEV